MDTKKSLLQQLMALPAGRVHHTDEGVRYAGPLAVQEQPHRCSHCHGEGTIECERCEGDGCEECGFEGEMPCYVCHGTGR